MSRNTRAPGTRAIGSLGERLAERYLEAKGLRVIARNLHRRHAEIDLVAIDGDALCFVEVRLRSSARFGGAAESVDARKQRRIRAAAVDLLASGTLPRASRLRFDVVAIDGPARERRITHYADAF